MEVCKIPSGPACQRRAVCFCHLNRTHAATRGGLRNATGAHNHGGGSVCRVFRVVFVETFHGLCPWSIGTFLAFLWQWGFPAWLMPTAGVPGRHREFQADPAPGALLNCQPHRVPFEVRLQRQ